MSEAAKQYLLVNGYNDTEGWVSKDYCNPIDIDDLAELLEAYYQDQLKANSATHSPTSDPVTEPPKKSGTGANTAYIYTDRHKESKESLTDSWFTNVKQGDFYVEWQQYTQHGSVWETDAGWFSPLEGGGYTNGTINIYTVGHLMTAISLHKTKPITDTIGCQGSLSSVVEVNNQSNELLPQWISVEDRLPSVTDRVLVIHDTSFHPTFGMYTGENEKWIILSSNMHIIRNWEDGATNIRVTHWMAAPNMPQP